MPSRIERRGDLPTPSELLHKIDLGARANAQQAKNASLAVARDGAPGSFGSTNMMGSVRRRPHGYEIVIQIRPKVRWRAVFPEGGTGVHGPKGKPIRRKRGPLGRRQPFILPSGARVKEIPGQPAQRFMERNRPKAATTSAAVFREGGRRAVRRGF